MKAVNCSPSTLAKTMKTSAKPPLVIHIFSPVSDEAAVGLPRRARLARRARRSRSPTRSARRRRSISPLTRPRQVALLLLVGAEAEERHDREAGLRAERRGERRRARRPLRRRRSTTTLSSSTPPNASGTSVPSSPSSPQRCDQRRARAPSPSFEPLERRHAPRCVDELVGRLRDQPMLVGELLGREDRPRRVSSISQAPPRVVGLHGGHRHAQASGVRLEAVTSSAGSH